MSRWKKHKAEPPGGLFDAPLSHTADPESSKEAASRHVESGKRDRHADMVLALVRLYPEHTAVELWKLATAAERAELVEMQEIRRRLTCLLHDGRVVQGEQRKCLVRGSTQITWTATGGE